MLKIRTGTPADVSIMIAFVRELAAFQREPDAVMATEADFLRDGFGLAADGVTKLEQQAPTRFCTLIAEFNGVAEGFALYFTSYSTWLGHHGIRLEDLYVSPATRGRGVGKALLAELANIAVAQGCSRLEWEVLDWNESAIAMYHAIGAGMQTDWNIMRLAGAPLRALAAQSVSA